MIVQHTPKIQEVSFFLIKRNLLWYFKNLKKSINIFLSHIILFILFVSGN